MVFMMSTPGVQEALHILYGDEQHFYRVTIKVGHAPSLPSKNNNTMILKIKLHRVIIS